MTVHLKLVKYQTIVITGATSGIGLATARMAAARGAKCVLVARDETALRELVDEIRRSGGSAAFVAVDVADANRLREVTQTAVEQFGGYDTWVNNAGVSAYGPMLNADPADHRRVFDINFWGVVNGSLEAVRHFRQRTGHYGGAIINLGALVSDIGIPMQGVYAASKHAIKGFTDTLRMEQEAAGAPISITLVKPGSIATPFPEHAANTMAQQPLPPPLYEPDVVAECILHCAEQPKRDVYIGGASKLTAALGRYAPRLLDLIMESTAERSQKTRRRAHRQRSALYEPATGRRQRGRFASPVFKTSLYSKASLHPVITGVAVAGVALVAISLYRYGLPRKTATRAQKTAARTQKKARKQLRKQARRMQRRLNR